MTEDPTAASLKALLGLMRARHATFHRVFDGPTAIRQASTVTSPPISQIGKLRRREATQLSKGHAVTEERILDEWHGWQLPTPDGWSEGELPLDGHGCPSDPPTSCVTQASSLDGLFVLRWVFWFCFFFFLAGVLFYFVANSSLPWLSQRRKNLWLTQEIGGACVNKEEGRPKWDGGSVRQGNSYLRSTNCGLST